MTTPHDGMAQTADTVADVLERAADLIEPEGAWIQGVFQSEDGCSHCLHSAVMEQADDFLKMKAATQALGFNYSEEVWVWNDAPGRTQAEVVAKLREAARSAREQGL